MKQITFIDLCILFGVCSVLFGGELQRVIDQDALLLKKQAYLDCLQTSNQCEHIISELTVEQTHQIIK